jgi:hypothetical protein
MQRFRGVRIFTGVAITCVIAAATAWTVPARAAQRLTTLKTIAGTVSCATSQGATQIYAIAYRPSLGYAAALVRTGFPDTPATVDLVGVETDKSNYTIDKGCGRTKAKVRLSHRGLSLSAVVKAGYNQSPEIYCAAPKRIIVRYRIGLASSGKPATATMAVWAKRKKASGYREIGYVQWSRSRSTAYYSRKACTSQ